MGNRLRGKPVIRPCVVCQQPIPAERRRRATCSEPCEKEIPFWKTETGPRAIVGSAIDKQVERALRPAVSAFGSVQGILGSVKAYGQHYFSVWDDFSGYAIRCYFEPDRLDEVKSNLTKHVSIGGWVSYFADGRPKSVSRINQISELRPLGWKSGKDYWGAMRDLSTGSG